MWDTFIINPMINALLFLYQLLGGSFGLAIIVFTIVIRLATYPLTARRKKACARCRSCNPPRNGWTCRRSTPRIRRSCRPSR